MTKITEGRKRSIIGRSILFPITRKQLLVKNKKTLILVAVIILLSLLVINGQKAKRDDQPNVRQHVDFTRFPIVDYAAPASGDAGARANRAAKGKKYNNKYAPVITESSNGIFVVNESLSGLPALPTDRSSVILIGEVTSAEAHLSEDGTAIYSEFKVRIQSVLKNNSKRVLTLDNLVEAERYGGRLRLPSGKLVISAVDHQDMPQVGSRYLLFLTNDFPEGGHNDEDFHILMGYELKAGKVFPLDKTSSKHPISRYFGSDESVLLTDLASALAAPSPTGMPN